MSKRAVLVAVVGERDASDELRALARDVGAAIANRGGIVLCGAMGGVMEAASQGCADAGGLVVGIVPTARTEDANPFVAIPIVTGMGEARNAIIARSAETMIAIGGSFGTLSEIALALRFGVPVVGIDTWRFTAPRHESDPIVRASSAAQAVKLAFDLAPGRRTDR